MFDYDFTVFQCDEFAYGDEAMECFADDLWYEDFDEDFADVEDFDEFFDDCGYAYGDLEIGYNPYLGCYDYDC